MEENGPNFRLEDVIGICPTPEGISPLMIAEFYLRPAEANPSSCRCYLDCACNHDEGCTPFYDRRSPIAMVSCDCDRESYPSPPCDCDYECSPQCLCVGEESLYPCEIERDGCEED